ncbi:hypothetical protein PGB90_002791 [Kerria lacca]
MDVSIDNCKNNVKTELRHISQSYDEANPFILPSTKRKTKKKNPVMVKAKLLSKKERKRLEKIRDKKKKKGERATLLQALADIEAPPELIPKLVSITEIQTKGRKRMFNKSNEISTITTPSNDKKINIYRTKIEQNKKGETCCRSYDANIIGFTSSDYDDTESEADDENRFSNKNNIEKLVQNKNTGLLKNDKMQESIQNQNLVKEIKKPEQSNQSEDTKQNEVCLSVSKKTFVPILRSVEIQQMRLKLPILSEEHLIMESINENDVVIITGETGSGKTTQVPQFLYEAGYCSDDKMIGITEPRRVAAISMSQRVAKEMNLSSDEVSYLIRFEGNTSAKTQIKFMTDGVLLKEMKNDFILRKYSAIIVDEAHERNIFSDILIGCLSRVTTYRRNKLKKPLKLIIMSATLNLGDYIENNKLFSTTPPVIKLNTRQFGVMVHFNKKTPVDYVKEAFQRAVKIHTRLPDGQQEVNRLVKKLRKTFPLPHDFKKQKILSNNEIKIEKIDETHFNIEDKENDDSDFEVSAKKFKQRLKKMKEDCLPNICLEDYATKPEDDEMEMYDTDDELDEEFFEESLILGHTFQPMWVLPLYSLLPSKEQTKVFEEPPKGCRYCVVATNIAETSITIPYVKYVIDCGRTKVKLYDKVTGVSTYQVIWTSKASADQRAGRAGRTSSGHCYRLYSSAVFNDFEAWSPPEIKTKPIDNLLMQMKALNLECVIDFPFPSAPDTLQLKTAEKRLTLLGALEQIYRGNKEYCSKLTPLGENMAKYPVAPRFAKMLCLGSDFDILPYIVLIVAALSVQQLLLNANDETSQRWRTLAGTGDSFLLGDVMVLLRALGAAEYARTTNEGLEKFCARYGLRCKAVIEARKLRVQLTNEINLNVPNLNLAVDPCLPVPTNEQARRLRQIILCGLADQVARRLTDIERKVAKITSHKPAYRVSELEHIIYINSSSILKKQQPEWIVYQEVYQMNNKFYARGITSIEPEWLPEFAAPYCNISEPLKDPPPYFDKKSGRVKCYINSSFGRSGWILPLTSIDYPAGLERFKWFAQFFLEGIISPKLQKYRYELLSSPDTIFKGWAKFLTGRVNSILRVLTDKGIDSREKLHEEWKKNSKYLLNEYREWLPQETHVKIIALWPPVEE